MLEDDNTRSFISFYNCYCSSTNRATTSLSFEYLGIDCKPSIHTCTIYLNIKLYMQTCTGVDEICQTENNVHNVFRAKSCFKNIFSWKVLCKYCDDDDDYKDISVDAVYFGVASYLVCISVHTLV